MKRLLIIGLLIMTLFLTGCGETRLSEDEVCLNNGYDNYEIMVRDDLGSDSFLCYNVDSRYKVTGKLFFGSETLLINNLNNCCEKQYCSSNI